MGETMLHKSITTADIAKYLNISITTVDRVLNNRGRVAEKTRKRVLQAVKELGYVPNRAAKHLSKKTQCCIGVSYLFPDWFGAQINLGIEKAFTDLKDFGLKIIVRNTAQTTEEQIKQIREVLPELDGLAVAPWESYKFADFLDELVERGLPVATFNNDVPASKRLFYVGSDYVAAGRLCGLLISKLVRHPGKVGIIIRNENIPNIEQRITGFRSFISNDPNLKIIGPFKTSRILEESIIQIKTIIDDNPDMVGLFVASDNLASAGYALKELGKTDQIKLVGYDLNERHYTLIQEDVIQAVVCQEPFYQGYYPIKILFDYITEGTWPVHTEIITRQEIVMKENLKFYYNYQPY